MTTAIRLPAAGAAALLLAIAFAALPLALAAVPSLPGLGLIALAVLALRGGLARRCPPWLPSVLAFQLVALCLLRLLGALPCDTACQGGGHYQSLGPLPVVVLALSAFAVLAALALRDLRRGAPGPALSRLAYALAGGSLFFLWISATLGLACPFCRAVHLTVLIAAGCCPPPPGAAGAPSWRAAAGWLALGFLVLNLAFHHQAVGDGPGAGSVADNVARLRTPAAADPPDAALAAQRASREYRALDAGRGVGPPDARYRVLLVVDPHCRTCAEEYGPLLAALLPLATGAQPRLALSTQFLVRASDASSADLARHLLATALLGPSRFRAVVAVALGSPAGSDFAALGSRIAEVDDPAVIAAAATRSADAIALVLADDARRLSALSGRAATLVTPQVVLAEQPAGAPPRLLRLWQGQLDAAALAGEIAALTRP